MKRNLILISLAAITLASCNIKTQVDEIKKIAKEELKASHEYRDSEKWGKVIEKDIEMGDFTSIQVNGAVDVYFVQSDTFKVSVLGNEKAIDEYKFFTDEDQFVIGLNDYEWDHKNHHIDRTTPAITAFIMAPSLKDITLYGAGDINISEGLSQASSLSINVNGAGDIECKNLEVGTVKVNVNGAGDIKLKKAVCKGNAEIVVNGAGDVDAKIKCLNASVIVNGAGDADIEVSCNDLTAECNGAGDIKLEGECKQFNKKDGIAGSIDSRNLTITGKTTIK